MSIAPVSIASAVVILLFALNVVAVVLSVRKANVAALVLSLVGVLFSAVSVAIDVVALPIGFLLGSMLISLLTGLIAIVFPARLGAVPIFVHETGPVRIADYRPTNGLSIAALIVVFFSSVVGVVLGHVALVQVRRSGEHGHSLALAAVVIGWVLTALWITLIGGSLALNWHL